MDHPSAPPARQSATIVIPTFNRAELLREALESVRALALPEGWEIELLVIDNNSTDHTANVVDAWTNHAGEIPHRRVRETRQGLSYARNRALAEAAGEWTIFLDDDMRIAPGWLIAFDEAVRSSAADIVTGPVRPRFEGPVPTWCCERLLASVTSSYSLRGDSIRELTDNERHEIPGCNFAVRTSMGLKVGGFDTGFGRTEYGMLAGEDFEFALRVAKAGGTAVYAPGCAIVHLVNNAKLSREGLRARWQGLGATDKRMREMHFSTRRLRLIHARLRVLRYRMRSWLLSLSGSPAAFRWRLEAERLERSI